jgi:hypothetical protein
VKKKQIEAQEEAQADATVPTTRPDEREVVAAMRAVADRLQDGDAECLVELRQRFPAEMVNDLLSQSMGDLSLQTEFAVTPPSYKENPINREALDIHTEEMRKQLASANPSYLEKLLIERIICGWINVNVAEMECASLRDCTLAKGEYYQRRIDRAQKRFLQACKALAQIRRLMGPNVQINVGEKQINIVEGRTEPTSS